MGEGIGAGGFRGGENFSAVSFSPLRDVDLFVVSFCCRQDKRLTFRIS